MQQSPICQLSGIEIFRGRSIDRSWSKRTGFIAVLVVATLWSVASGGVAYAHNGETEFIGEVGPFFVEVVDEPLPNGTLLYTLTLRDLERGLPIDDAEVTVAATFPTQDFGPESTSRFANAYQIILPMVDVGFWTLDVSISHPDFDDVAFSHGLQGPDTGPWWTTRPILIGVWLLPVAGAVVLFRGWTPNRGRFRSRNVSPRSSRRPR